MALKHSVYDTDAHFKIDPITRTIKNESPSKTVLIQHDHNSERLTFEMSRMVDGHDMSKCDVVQIHYINIDSKDKNLVSKDAHDLDDLQISPDGDDVVIFSWLIDGNATKYAGTLSFLVKFKCIGDDGFACYVWNTAPFTGISVSAGIDNGEDIVEEYSDILEQWRQELFESGGSGGSDTGEVAGAFYVTVSGTNGAYTADKTYSEILEAYNSGKAVYMIADTDDEAVDMSGRPAIMVLNLITEDTAGFYLVYDNYYATYMIERNDTISYYESKMRYEDDEGNALPEVTSDNNGAFLRVVNGNWAAVSMENAEGVKF